MTEEERKAVEILNTFEFRGKTRNYKEISSEDSKSVKIVLNLIEKLQKENEEIRIKNNAIKRESEAYVEYMIRLDIEKQNYFEKYRYYLQQNESLTKEFSNVIPVQKIKDKIEEYKNMLKTCNKVKDIDRIKAINERILELQELLEGRK